MKRFKFEIGVICIFFIIIIIETTSFAAYNSYIQEENEQKEMQIQEIENEDNQNILNEEEKEVLQRINAYRTQNGLQELKAYAQLQKVAKIKARDMVQNSYFSHTSPTYGTPFDLLKQNKIQYQTAGENLAGNISSEKAVEAWILSKSHRENILEDKYQYTGICVIESEIYGKIFVQFFMGI